MNILDVMLIVLVIYVPNQLHFPADLGLKGMNVLNILLALTLLAMVATGAKARSPAPVRWRIGLLALLFVVSFFVGQFRAPGDALQDLVVLKSLLTQMLMYFIFYHAARDQDRARRLVAAILLVAFVAAVEAAREGLEYGFSGYAMSHRVSGPFGHDYQNSNRAGAFYAIFLPQFLSLALFRRDIRAALVGLTGTAFTAIAIFATYSRQAFLIAALATLALALKRSAIVGLLAVALVAGWRFWAPAAVVERVGMTYVETEGGEEELEVSARSRLRIWEGAGQLISQNPFGIGLNRFRGEIGDYAEVSGKDAHNAYVLLTAEAGLQGIVALLLVLAGLIAVAVRLIRSARDDETRAFGYGYLVSVACMMLGNLFGSPFFSVEVMGNFWSLSGVAARYPSFRSHDVRRQAMGQIHDVHERRCATSS